MKRNHSTRRDFLKTSALAAASAPFFGALRPRAHAAESKRKLGFALVGLGSLSTNQIAPALQKTKHCRLAAVVTGTPAKAEKWKTQYNLPDQSIYNYETLERMADNPHIDVVYVVTPNALHAHYTIKAAKAGKHVLCEKPVEVSTEKCQTMIAECKKAGKQLAIGYRCHFELHHLECVRLARERTFGDIRGRRSDGKELRFDSIDQFAAEMDDFAQCILNNQPTKVPGEEGLRDVKIMTAIYEAAKTGKSVTLG